MGSFYVDHLVRCRDAQAVERALCGRDAQIRQMGRNCILVNDEESQSQNLEIVFRLAGELSSTLACPVLVVVNHDDDVLICALFEDGRLVDQYCSSPDYFKPIDKPSNPVGGDATKLAIAFRSPNLAEIEAILRRPSFGEGGYIFSSERHADLLSALGIPQTKEA